MSLTAAADYTRSMTTGTGQTKTINETVIIYILYFVSSTSCLKILQNEEIATNSNVTTLYPVDNITYHKGNADSQKSRVKDGNEKQNTKIYSNVDTNDNNIKEYEDEQSLRHSSEVKDEELQNKNEEKTLKQEKGNKRNETKLIADTTTWKVNATYSKSKLQLDEDVNTSDTNLTERDKSRGKEFKPSPHLGNFYDEDSFVIPTQATIGSFSPVVSRPSLEIISSPKDLFQLQYQQPLNSYHGTINPPYEFENLAPRTKDWKFETSSEAKPTEKPTAIPAGGLYKYPDAFKEKPGKNGDDDDFGLDFNDSKDTSVKKRHNPWKKILNLVTALIPVGIIISALTPSIVTLEDTGNYPHFPSRVSRRSDESVNELPPISEQCKRRLLCELHSDANFVRDSRPRRPNLCYKIHCSDPQALSKLLHWLFLRNQRQHPLQDRRGYIP